MDEITLRVPALPESLRLVRLIAAGLASRLNFTIDEIEDLKIAVDELASYLTGTRGRDGTLEITFAVTETGIEVMGRCLLPAGVQVRTDLTDLSRQILATVADSASLAVRDGIPQFAVAKRRPASEPAP